MCIVQLSLPYWPVMLSLPYWPSLLYQPVLLLAQPSPVPTCSAALLMDHSSFLAVQAWTGGEEPYSQDLLYWPVPPIPTCPAALLPARSSFLTIPAWAHGEVPYSYPVPACHALFSLLYLWPGHTSLPSPPPRWRENPQELEI
jgi:hypothetical protein